MHVSQGSVVLTTGVLQVDTFQATIAQNVMVGSDAALTDQGSIVHAWTPVQDMEDLSQLLQTPLAATVNRGSDVVGAGSRSVGVVESMFKLQKQRTGMRSATIDNLLQRLKGRFPTTARIYCTEIHDRMMPSQHRDQRSSQQSENAGLSVIDMRDANKVNKFLVKTGGSWHRRWNR